MDVCDFWIYIFILLIKLGKFSASIFPHFFFLNPSLPPKYETTWVRMLDIVTWITETFHFFLVFLPFVLHFG